jgi:hypothetical protein
MSIFQDNNIQTSELLIHSDVSTLPLVDIHEGERFGIVKFKMEKTRLVTTPIFLLFTIDKTGSMKESHEGYSGTSKMDYVKQTFVNMMNYLSTLETDIYIQVNTFHTTVETLVNYVKIHRDNVESIKQKIKSIEPDGSTNIGIALNAANMILNTYAEMHSSHQYGHIFMTDGEPNMGITDSNELCNLVNDAYMNIFVGFGLCHNVGLLSKFASKKNADYQFVDDMENTALVYGETIHKFIYPALRKVELRIEDGLLYDWQKNQWVSCLYEDIIIGEIEKMYQLKTIRPDMVKVDIYGEVASYPVDCEYDSVNNEFRLLETISKVPDLINQETQEIEIEPVDLTKYAFRQKVQELLFKAKQTHLNKTVYVRELKEAFRVIHRYMRVYGLEEDPLLQLLCEDISVTYRTIGSANGNMFAMARYTSQGRQKSYVVKSKHAAHDESMMLKRDGATPNLRRENRFPDMARMGSVFNSKDEDDADILNTGLSLQIPKEDELNNDPFTKYEKEGFFVPPANVFKDIYADEEFEFSDEIDEYVATENDVSCFATPELVNTMRSMSQPPTV